MEDDDYPSYKLNAQNYSKDDKREEIPFSVGLSFQDYLENQLGLRSLDEKQHLLAFICLVILMMMDISGEDWKILLMTWLLLLI